MGMNSRSSSPSSQVSSRRSACDVGDLPPPRDVPPRDSGDLLSRLAAAETALKADPPEPSEGTMDSEERDMMFLSQQIEDELEKNSQRSMSNSDGDRDERRFKRRTRGHHIKRPQHRLPAASTTTSSSSSLSTFQLQQLQQTLEEAASNSTGSSHGYTNEELWNLLQKSSSDLAALRTSMASAASEHGVEMERTTAILEAAQKRDNQNDEDMAEQLAKVFKMETSHVAQILSLNSQLANSRQSRIDADEQNDEMIDQMAGLEARHKFQVDKLLAEMKAQKDTQDEEDTVNRQANSEERDLQKSEIANFLALLEKAKRESRSSSDERDVLRRNAMSSASSMAAINNLQEQLDVANKELSRRHLQDEEQEKVWGNASSAAGARRQERADFKNLHDLLKTSQGNEGETIKELSELRLQMLNMKAGQAAEMTDLQGRLDAANRELDNKESNHGSVPFSINRLGNRRTLPLGVWGSKLTSINEEDADMLSADGSIAASANVSSNADGDEVADIHDFDEALPVPDSDQAQNLAIIAKLKEDMAEDKVAHDLLKEEMAGNDAWHASKAARLMRHLAQNRLDKVDADEITTELRQSLAGEGARHQNAMDLAQAQLLAAAQKNDRQDIDMDALKLEVQSSQDQQGQDKFDIGELRQQLYSALAAKHIAEARADDYKAAMNAMRIEGERTIADLKTQVKSLKVKAREPDEEPDEEDGEALEKEGPLSELVQLRQRVNLLTEERNILLNTLEWKEVQWRNSIEDLEQQMVSQGVDLRAQNDAKVEELRLQLEGTIAPLRQKLAEKGEPPSPSAA